RTAKDALFTYSNTKSESRICPTSTTYEEVPGHVRWQQRRLGRVSLHSASYRWCSDGLVLCARLRSGASRSLCCVHPAPDVPAPPVRAPSDPSLCACCSLMRRPRALHARECEPSPPAGRPSRGVLLPELHGTASRGQCL